MPQSLTGPTVSCQLRGGGTEKNGHETRARVPSPNTATTHVAMFERGRLADELVCQQNRIDDVDHAV